MEAADHERLLERLMAYCRACGLRATARQQQQILALIDAIAAEGREHDLERALQLAPDYLDLPRVAAAIATPALKRGSMGYGSRDR